MGQIESSGIKSYEKVTINMFEFKYIIGRGGFGKVWKVVCKKNGKEYAMKVMSKVKIIDRKSQKSIISERNLLSKLCHPFLVNMVYSFQDADHLYLVMDLLTGGDLRYHISRKKCFSQDQTKFFLACLILGLEYIHENAVLHRDIKPENLVCDEKGYIRITDFGVAKKYHKDNASETSGTPGYMAPEVLCSQNHSYGVDYFALGIIGYEFMLGKRPYHGKNRKEVKVNVLQKQMSIKAKEIPEGWSLESAVFINDLIQRKPSQRLGYSGIADIKTHQWFSDFPWHSLMQKKTISPFIPKVGDNFDRHYCEGEEKIGEETQERYQNYLKDDSYSIVFNKYTCNNISPEEYQTLASIQAAPNVNLNSNNSIANATTISSMKRTLSNLTPKDITYNINMLPIKPKLKMVDALANKSKQNANNINQGLQSLRLSKEGVKKLKNSFLTPSSMLYSSNANNNNFFYSNDANLPIINGTSKKRMKKSSSSSHFINNNTNNKPHSMNSSRPQTNNRNLKEAAVKYSMNSPLNVRQFNFTNRLMNSTSMAVRPLKRNKSSMSSPSVFSVNNRLNN